MKKILILLLFCNSSFAQEAQGFKIVENSITWKHVYNADLSQDQIKSQLLADPYLNPIGQNFAGESNPKKMECKEATAIYWDAQLYYFARIQFKEGKYLVEVSNFQLIPNYSINFNGVESTKNPEALESFVLKNQNQEFKPGKLHQNALECLGQFLLQKFNFQEKSTAVEW